MKSLIGAAICCSLMFLIPTFTYGTSAEWDVDPISGDWNTPQNWTPNAVPNGPADIATFGFSHTTDVSISAPTEVNSLIFSPAATNPYTITSNAGGPAGLDISGSGITNNSGVMQNFAVPGAGALPGGRIFFFNTATAGNLVTFTIEGGTLSGFGNGGSLAFFDASSAGNATIINNGTLVNGSVGGVTEIGVFQRDTATAGSSTLIANAGIGQRGGGSIIFDGDSRGGTSRIEVFGNGQLDVSQHNHESSILTIGSIEGDGNVFLGANRLRIGSNNLSTEFSGEMQDGGRVGGTGGSLIKIGTGTLVLSGKNTYTGATDVSRGTLQIDGSITSNTSVNAEGKLAGRGTVYGNVTSNRGGEVLPGDASGVPGVLTVTHNYTERQYATLMIQIAGTSAGDFSVLNVLGNADVNGNVAPVFLNGFLPAVGDSFTFLNYSSITGGFSQILNQVFNHGTEQWFIVYRSNNAILTVAAANVPVPDYGPTFLLLAFALLGLVLCRCRTSSACREF